MRQLLFLLGILAFISACKNEKAEAPAVAASDSVTLPYTANYSSSWDMAVSDSDVNTVLLSYKYWADGNMDALMGTMGDSTWVDHADGRSRNYSNAELRSLWTSGRDSMSSVSISMDTWHKMRTTDKNDHFVVVWYKMTETYKDGRVDSAYWHDVNMVKNGKIVWYSQYKRPIVK